MTHTDTSSANANIDAAPQIIHTDISFANADITAAPHITHTDTSCANANIIAVPQMTHADTSSANAKIGPAPQITQTETSFANTNIPNSLSASREVPPVVALRQLGAGGLAVFFDAAGAELLPMTAHILCTVCCVMNQNAKQKIKM